MSEGQLNVGDHVVWMQEGQRFSGSVDATYNNLATSPMVVSTCRRQAVCPASMSSMQWGQYGKADIPTKTHVSTLRSSKACWLPNSLSSIALPAISSGVFGFPVDRSTRTITSAVKDFLKDHPQTRMKRVSLVDPAGNVVNAFRRSLRVVFGPQMETTRSGGYDTTQRQG